MVYAQADTAAELALISKSYVKAHKIPVDPGGERIQFADGSLERTVGTAKVVLTIPVLGTEGPCPWKQTRFHVLPNCKFDLLLSGELIVQFALFQKTPVFLAPDIDILNPSLAAIIHLGPVEKSMTRVASKTKKWRMCG